MLIKLIKELMQTNKQTNKNNIITKTNTNTNINTITNTIGDLDTWYFFKSHIMHIQLYIFRIHMLLSTPQLITSCPTTHKSDPLAHCTRVGMNQGHV